MRAIPCAEVRAVWEDFTGDDRLDARLRRHDEKGPPMSGWPPPCGQQAGNWTAAAKLID